MNCFTIKLQIEKKNNQIIAKALPTSHLVFVAFFVIAIAKYHLHAIQ